MTATTHPIETTFPERVMNLNRFMIKSPMGFEMIVYDTSSMDPNCECAMSFENTKKWAKENFYTIQLCDTPDNFYWDFGEDGWQHVNNDGRHFLVAKFFSWISSEQRGRIMSGATSSDELRREIFGKRDEREAMLSKYQP